jgi:hypothetical protein
MADNSKSATIWYNLSFIVDFEEIFLRKIPFAFYITNSYFTALHGYAGVSLAAVAGGTPAYP